jgi:hypothetical protein
VAVDPGAEVVPTAIRIIPPASSVSSLRWTTVGAFLVTTIALSRIARSRNGETTPRPDERTIRNETKPSFAQ